MNDDDPQCAGVLPSHSGACLRRRSAGHHVSAPFGRDAEIQCRAGRKTGQAVTLLTRLVAHAETEDRCPHDRRAELLTEMLFLALDLAGTTWKLALGVANRSRASERFLPAIWAACWTRSPRRNVDSRIAADAPVRSCYEAGRDGFWLHRALRVHGVENVVIDPSAAGAIRADRHARSRCQAREPQAGSARSAEA